MPTLRQNWLRSVWRCLEDALKGWINAEKSKLIRIIIIGSAYAFFGEDRTENYRSQSIEKISGLVYYKDLVGTYFSETFQDIRIEGGAIGIFFDASLARLQVITKYLSPRRLSRNELSALVQKTQGQWSEGIGESCFDSNFEKTGIDISTWEVGQTVSVSQRSNRRKSA